MSAQLSGKEDLKKGLALVEVMIALGLFAFMAVALWVLVFQSQDFLQDISLRLSTVAHAYGFIETNIFHSFANQFEPTVSKTTTATMTVEYITPCLARITERETWRSFRANSISASGLTLDISEIKNRGLDCGGFPDDQRLDDVSTVPALPLPLPTGLQATGIDVVKKSVFVSFISADPLLPDLLSATIVSDQTGSHLTNERTIDIGSGLNSIDAAGGFVYGVRKDSADQFVVIDARYAAISGLSLVASSTLPGVAGAYPEGFSIFYYDSRVYVGTKRTAGHEFHIFDVTQPRNPVWLGSREVNHNINEIVVRREGSRSFAFLATSGNTRDLIILDVSNPAAITQINSLDLPGNEDGRSIALMGHHLFIGRFKSTRGNPDFYKITLAEFFADPSRTLTADAVLGSYTVGADVNTIRIAHNNAFLGTAKTPNPFVVLNIASSTHMFVEDIAMADAKITALDYQDNTFIGAVFGGEQVVFIQQ